MTTAVDDSLLDWATLKKRDWPTLLIGNGFSINLWDGFRYDSLFGKAHLKGTASAIFADIPTTNFETALEWIHHTRVVSSALGKKTGKVDRTYVHVREALFAAVNSAHVPWDQFPVSSHGAIAWEMDAHRNIFTTNYDLSLYWSHMQTPTVDLKDYFWTPDHTFDPGNTSSQSALIHYLHGGLHLWTDDRLGKDGKWTSATGNLLHNLNSKYKPTSNKRPLFVSEGTSRSKVHTIRRSAYLTYCLDQLRSDGQNTVIFGHGLTAQDDHIVEAVSLGPKRTVAVSIHPSGNSKEIIAEKARIQKVLARQKCIFFDSTTHPLGDPALHISMP